MSCYAFYVNAYANATTAQTSLLPVVLFVSSSLSSFKKKTRTSHLSPSSLLEVLLA